MKWMTLVIVLCWILLAAALMNYCTGCGIFPKTPAATLSKNGPAPLSTVSAGLAPLILLSVIGFGVGVGLFLVSPAAHQLSLTIAGVAAGIGTTSLFLAVTIPFLPWLVGGLGMIALLALGYEIYVKMKSKGSKST